MKTYELIMPDARDSMYDLGYQLTLEMRELAAQYELTVDGNISKIFRLPNTRWINSVQLGGVLLPKGGVKKEAGRQPFLERAQAFARKMFAHLAKMQVMGLGDDLEPQYDIEIRVDKKGESSNYSEYFFPIASTSAGEVADNLRFSKHTVGKNFYPVFSWKIIRRKNTR